MIISCPNCSTQFRLNADLLGDTGRNVKCAKCAHRWFAEATSLSEEPVRAAAPRQSAPKPAAPPPPAPPPPSPPPPAPPPPVEAKAEDDAPPALEAAPPSDEEDEAFASPPPIPTEEEIARFQTKPQPERKSTLKWWILLFVGVVVVVGCLFYFPRDIVAFYPPTNKLYAALGMASDVLGSGLEITDYDIQSRQEGQVRAIKGKVKNTTSHVIDVPPLIGTIKDSKNKVLRIWFFRTKEPRVLPGESVVYETELRNPPRGGTKVDITFITEAEMDVRKAAAKSSRAKRK